MSVRSLRYIIDPPSACPPGLLTSAGTPVAQIQLDLDDVARSAWNEILQTAPGSSSLFAFFEDLLEPGTDLVWSGSGPGRGTEMRRSFSGLFGRFFARAYLQLNHGFVWFTAIDGNNFPLSPNWRVRRKSRSKTNMPDWICVRPGELAIGEAKGTHQAGNCTRGGRPGPIKTADGQLKGVVVEKRTGARLTGWTAKSVKGWAVMSRWGTADPARDPFMYVLDPKTDGEPLTSDEIEELSQVVARKSVEQTALGLRLLQEKGTEIFPAPRQRVTIAGDSEKRGFAGAIVSPFGILDVGLDQAVELAARIPNPNAIRFVGLEEEVLATYLEGGELKPAARRKFSDDAIVGPDGLVVAPVTDTKGS